MLVQYHFRLTRLFSLAPANFYPPPQVDSVVLRLAPEPPDPAAQDEALLHRVVKAAFGHRRKTLNNTLAAQAPAFGLTPEAMRALLAQLSIDSGAPGRNPERGGICGTQQQGGAFEARAGPLRVRELSTIPGKAPPLKTLI